MPAVKLLDSNFRQQLDRYELVGELASGGMATVFLGRIGGVGGFQRFVAIKRLHPHLAHEQEFIEMFVDEARLAASIHHPNVVPILDIGASDQGYYLVMEYIEGDTLARLLARAASQGERLPIPIALRILLDTLAGLHAAHELRDEKDELLGVVHRDVSPQNILVGVDGTSRITDFGVAQAASRLTTTRGGQLKGKLAYMAPEQARGQTIDRRSDVFATGTVLWEVLAGRRLFRADADAETLNRVLFEPIPRLRDVDPAVPAALDAVAARALERDPDKRYATCFEFADALERAARATRLTASARDVAAYVQSVLGQEIQQQREAVRAWVAASEPSRMSTPDRLTPPPLFTADSTRPGSSVSAASITIRHEDPGRLGRHARPDAEDRSSPRRNALWVGVGAASAFLVLGVFGIFWTRSAPPPTIEASPASAAAPEASPGESPSPPVPAAPSAAQPVQTPPPVASAVWEPDDIEEDEPAPIDTRAPIQKAADSTRGREPAPPGKKPAPVKAPRPSPPSPSLDDFVSNPYR